MKIGEVLKKIRLIHTIPAKELATKLSISPSYLSEIENNKKIPNIALLEKYSKVFDLKVSSIILMAEDYEDKKRKSVTDKFIQKRMINLLNYFSKNKEGIDE
ncbi:helix-turn-helix transcriptional regulator [Staphylococcus simulans]|uniref:helix-turn-helix domain-containing protein n=1 Tax=Staphylococcus simulans TaxID=1286 RepID=UPI0021D07D7C|nr:helix-turn-helix transcriptional regulator [Staphylococcus simulans]UXR38013.1 helix-turn-helix transcriptional regulator [Staphylococcus simulans]